MALPVGDMKVLRGYTCGCTTYLDQLGVEHEERGLYCNEKHDIRGHDDFKVDTHQARLWTGIPTQRSLFDD